MPEYIERGELISKLQEHHDFFIKAYGGFKNLPVEEKARVNEITHCIAEVVNISAADVVEVVRCKDCKHRHSSEFCECREPDAFCSDGDRKEAE